MPKLQKLYDFLINIKDGLQRKAQGQREDLQNEQMSAGRLVKQHLRESLEYTEGQLYELNYIIDKFWEIVSKND